MSSKKPVLLSGIKPTGDLHIGNYFGAMRQQVELFKSGKYRCFIMIADYHALNTMQNAKEMRRRTRELITAYLAIGLDPKDVVLFKQSDVQEHTELAWIFDTITTMPYLMRAHAYKDALAKNKDINVGTFNYPMLMASDILLYDTEVVPVGADQKQHIEIARDTAQKFNHTFKDDLFTLPKPYIIPNVATVPGIDGQKMSKSYRNVIPLFASRDEVKKRVMSIVTDSSGEKPENVYAIHKLVRSEQELEPIYEKYKGKYKMLKEMLAEDLDVYFAPIRERYATFENESSLIDNILTKGAKEARAVTKEKMQYVKRAIGVI